MMKLGWALIPCGWCSFRKEIWTQKDVHREGGVRNKGNVIMSKGTYETETTRNLGRDMEQIHLRTSDLQLQDSRAGRQSLFIVSPLAYGLL